jgi:hypothetical protein
MNSIFNLFILFLILIVLGVLYRRFEDKRIREENHDSYEAIQTYLLDDVTLGKSKKPILWIHIPYEYNSRKWLSFGSRSSFDLNQPYLYLTVKSIIKQCDKSFTICIVDDHAFHRLIPGWKINMTTIADPILSNMRTMAMTKLLYIYGGLICPVSFLCIKNLIGLYHKGTRGNKMFLCETVDRNITSTEFEYYPNIHFCGAPKKNHMVMEFCNFIQQVMSRDHSQQSIFLGDFNRWCNRRIEERKINMISGLDIGVKTVEDRPILVEDLLGNSYIDLYDETYGILVPATEILSRRKYEWFSRLSEKQVLESDTILGNYILITIADGGGNVLEPLTPAINKDIRNKFVGFWRTPDYPGLYGLKPNYLGDNMIKQSYTGR